MYGLPLPGNSSIPNYEHMALVSGGLHYYGDAGIAPSQPGNEDLQWEKLWITNLAVHLGFWNRLNTDYVIVESSPRLR